MRGWTVYLSLSEIAHPWCHRTERNDAVPAGMVDIRNRPPEEDFLSSMTGYMDRLIEAVAQCSSSKQLILPSEHFLRARPAAKFLRHRLCKRGLILIFSRGTPVDNCVPKYSI